MSTDELTCSACLQPEADWKGSAKGPCGHSMCMPCFMTWVQLGKPSCPLCRGAFVSEGTAGTEGTGDAAALAAVAAEQHDYALAADRRWEARQASLARRTTFLHERQDEFRAHCLLCTDDECRKSHSRRMRWLERGKLVPCPGPLSKLPKLTIGLLLARLSLSRSKKYYELECQSARMGECITLRRQAGLELAILRQQDEAARVAAARQRTKGPGMRRGNIQTAVMFGYGHVDQLPEGCKVFKGFTPPKRGARVGDVWLRDEADDARGVCVGHNLWALKNNTKVYLDRATKKWVTD